LNPEFVGLQFYEELVSTFYENADLRTSDRGTDGLYALLYTKESFGVLGIFGQCLRKITITVHFLEKSWYETGTDILEVTTSLERLADGRCMFTLEADPCVDVKPSRVLAYLRPKLRIIKDSGFKVDIKHGEEVVIWE
jgi:hypothetical protein